MELIGEQGFQRSANVGDARRLPVCQSYFRNMRMALRRKSDFLRTH